MTVTSVVGFVQLAMFLAQGTMFVAKAYLLSLFGDAGVDGLHLVLTFNPFWFNHLGGLVSNSVLFLIF
jgi:hypothetical protein